MKDELLELFNNVRVEKVYYPFGSLCGHQDDLMEELAEKYDEGKLPEILDGKKITIWKDEDMQEVFADWMNFNEWISEESVTGYFASILTPILTDIAFHEDGRYKWGSCSFGYCHMDFIYYETTEELLEKGKAIFQKWRDYDINRAKKNNTQ